MHVNSAGEENSSRFFVLFCFVLFFVFSWAVCAC
jgi:hypothetical protein